MTELESACARITQLEELITHQQQLLHQLNGVIIELRRDYDLLKHRLQLRVAQLETLVENQLPGPDPLEKPPHY